MNAMNKIVSKKIFIKNKIKTPKFIFIKKNICFLKFFKTLKTKKFKYPLVVKPNNEGSSIGVKSVKINKL